MTGHDGDSSSGDELYYFDSFDYENEDRRWSPLNNQERPRRPALSKNKVSWGAEKHDADHLSSTSHPYPNKIKWGLDVNAHGDDFEVRQYNKCRRSRGKTRNTHSLTPL